MMKRPLNSLSILICRLSRVYFIIKKTRPKYYFIIFVLNYNKYGIYLGGKHECVELSIWVHIVDKRVGSIKTMYDCI
jgi:hypothetical protein